MVDAAAFIEQAPVQDQDLLLRLNLYFDVLDQRLRHGQGWFIFNAAGSRLNRIAGFIQAKLAADHASVDSYLMPWRDFALSAYVNEVGLAEIGPGKDGSSRLRRRSASSSLPGTSPTTPAPASCTATCSS